MVNVPLPVLTSLALIVHGLEGVKQTTESGTLLPSSQPFPWLVLIESVKFVPLGKALTVVFSPNDPTSTGCPWQSFRASGTPP